jgi:hypothetical protein
MCPHTTANVCPHAAIYVSSNCYIRVLILLCMCPHTAIYVSSYCYICVLILLYMCPHTGACLLQGQEKRACARFNPGAQDAQRKYRGKLAFLVQKYVLYSNNSTNTDTSGAACQLANCQLFQLLSFLALLVQKCKY